MNNEEKNTLCFEHFCRYKLKQYYNIKNQKPNTVLQKHNNTVTQILIQQQNKKIKYLQPFRTNTVSKWNTKKTRLTKT